LGTVQPALRHGALLSTLVLTLTDEVVEGLIRTG